MTIICSHCGESFTVSACREWLNHCSRACYLASLQLDPEQVARMARMGLTRSAAASTLGIPFPTFYRKLRRQGLNELFPAIGTYTR